MHESKQSKFKLTRYEDVRNPVLNKNEYPFWISEYGTTFANPQYQEIRYDSDVSCIEYIVSGSGIININNKSYIVKKGDSYMLLEGTNQNYYSDPDDPFTKIWINFKGILGREIINIYGLSDCVLFKNTNTLPYIEKIHNIISSNTDPKFIQEETSALFLRLIQFMADHKQQLTPESASINMIRYYIDCNITKNIKISDISNICHYTPQHIIKIFKEKYGITPHKYILNSKLKISLPMLRSTDKSIEEISNELGFSDTRHFSAQFEKFMGIRPSAYRKSINQ